MNKDVLRPTEKCIHSCNRHPVGLLRQLEQLRAEILQALRWQDLFLDGGHCRREEREQTIAASHHPAIAKSLKSLLKEKRLGVVTHAKPLLLRVK